MFKINLIHIAYKHALHLPDGRLSKTSYKNDDKFAKTKQMLCGTYSYTAGVDDIFYYEHLCRRWNRMQ